MGNLTFRTVATKGPILQTVLRPIQISSRTSPSRKRRAALTSQEERGATPVRDKERAEQAQLKYYVNSNNRLSIRTVAMQACLRPPKILREAALHSLPLNTKCPMVAKTNRSSSGMGQIRPN